MIWFFKDLDFQADKKRYSAKNRKKKAADSFSGIPAMVLGSNDGRTIRKNEEIKAIIFAFLGPRLSLNAFLTRKKKAITVIAKKKTG